MMRAQVGWVALFLAGCSVGLPDPAPRAPMAMAAPELAPLPIAQAAGNFIAVVSRVEPLAEQMCRDMARAAQCDFQIVIDDRPDSPPNAFQTLDEFDRPVIGFTLALIADARNADELAFVLGHEAAHHIAGHIRQRERSAMEGALLAGVLAQVVGAGEAGIQNAVRMGANLGAQTFSKEFELEADALGAEIAHFAGFDPVTGAAFFDRLPDPGDEFLGSHPANADRKAVVAATVARLSGV